jgi:hypothetical protein
VPIIELVDTSHHPPKSKAPTLDHSANPEKAAARGGILRKITYGDKFIRGSSLPADVPGGLVPGSGVAIADVSVGFGGLTDQPDGDPET